MYTHRIDQMRSRLLLALAALLLAALFSAAPVLVEETTGLSAVPAAQACGSQSGGC